MHYDIFEANGLYDFRTLILPDIYEQLLLIPDFGEAGITCIGAVSDENLPVGAVVIGFHEEPMLSVLSLYVKEKYRNRGIGSELLRSALACALGSFLFPDGNLQIGIRLEYVLPQESAESFSRFLRKNHFKIGGETEKICMLSADILREALEGVLPAEKVLCLQDLSEETASDTAAFMEDNSLTPALDYCFLLGAAEDPDLLLIAEYGAEGTLDLAGAVLHNNISEQDYLSVLSVLAGKLINDPSSPDLSVPTGRNPFPDFWEKTARQGGEIWIHGDSLQIADFNDGGVVR